jgi:hypothetical protein
MKNLVLSALCFVGLTQAAGCIIVSDDTSGDGTGDVTVTWALQSTDPAGNVVTAPCPAGGDNITINAKRGSDATLTDTYFCTDGAGIADRLPAGRYTVWITITDGSGAIKIAESDGFLVDVAAGANTPVLIDVFTDRAFFQATWDLTRNGNPTTCVAEGAVNMSILATVSGGANGFDDDSHACFDGEANKSVFTTTPVPVGSAYTVVIAALNAAGASIGDSDPITNRTFEYGNAYEPLPDTIVPIR